MRELAWQLPPLPAGSERPDPAFEVLPQGIEVRAALVDRQVRLDELP